MSLLERKQQYGSRDLHFNWSRATALGAFLFCYFVEAHEITQNLLREWEMARWPRLSRLKTLTSNLPLLGPQFPHLKNRGIHLSLAKITWDKKHKSIPKWSESNINGSTIIRHLQGRNKWNGIQVDRGLGGHTAGTRARTHWPQAMQSLLEVASSHISAGSQAISLELLEHWVPLLILSKLPM